jgi:hypothetical protein
VITGRGAACSGTLVYAAGDEGFVLTAAHCIFDFFQAHGDYGVAPRSFRFGPAQDIEVEIGRVALHPSYGWDRSVRDAPEAELAAGDPVTLVGFGGPQLGMRQVAPARIGLVGEMPVYGSGSSDCMSADADSTAAGARGALPIIESILAQNRPPRPTTCPACAATTGFCTETRNALIRGSVALFEDCINERTPEGNFTRCSEQFPAIRTAYDAHWACLQGTCGEEVCTDAARLVTLCEYSHEGAGPCDECIIGNCCERASTCANDPVCRACANTTEPDAACRANASLRSLYECLGGRCEAECGPYISEVVARVLPPVGLPDAAVDAAPVDAARVDSAIDGGLDAGPDASAPAGGGDGGCQTHPGPGGVWPLALGLLLILRRLRPRKQSQFWSSRSQLAASRCPPDEVTWYLGNGAPDDEGAWPPGTGSSSSPAGSQPPIWAGPPPGCPTPPPRGAASVGATPGQHAHAPASPRPAEPGDRVSVVKRLPSAVERRTMSQMLTTPRPAATPEPTFADRFENGRIELPAPTLALACAMPR